MKKDIPILKVEDIVLAIVPPIDEADQSLWEVFLINLKDHGITNALVNSRGYGEADGRNVETSVLRHYFVEVAANSFVRIEPLQTDLFKITNEFWISFQANGYMYDKKYIFVKGSIDEMHFTEIPLIGRKGVMIR